MTTEEVGERGPYLLTDYFENRIMGYIKTKTPQKGDKKGEDF